MTFPGFTDAPTVYGPAVNVAVGLIPALVKYGIFFVVLAILYAGGSLLLGFVFGSPGSALPMDDADAISRNPSPYGQGGYCPICGLSHGPNYRGSHPRTML